MTHDYVISIDNRQPDRVKVTLDDFTLDVPRRCWDRRPEPDQRVRRKRLGKHDGGTVLVVHDVERGRLVKPSARSGLDSGRPRSRRTKRTSSSRGDPDEPGEQPALHFERRGAYKKRGGAS